MGPRAFDLGISMARLASGAPQGRLLLAGRWIFLAPSNFALMAYAWFGADSRHLGTLDIAGMALPFLLLSYQPFAYFDEVTPRPLAVRWP